MNDGLQTRALSVCIGMMLLFTLFSLRLIQIQIVRHDHYARLAAESHSRRVNIWSQRGLIRDRNGELLAGNLPVKTVVVDARRLASLGRTVEVTRVLAQELGLEEDLLRGRMHPRDQYVVARRRVPESIVDRLRERLGEDGMQGIYFEQDSVRVYPNGPMLCHVLGFVGANLQGQAGIERSKDAELTGVDGYRFIENDARGRELAIYRGQQKAARDGSEVQLTIDMGIQDMVERELDSAVATLRPKAALVILARPATGEILALACRPAFDLRDPAGAIGDAQNNRAVGFFYEPGSTFKIVAVAAALNERLVGPETLIYCENGCMMHAGRALHDHRPYGSLSVNQILSKSSNIGAAKLAMQLGEKRYYEYVRLFGFGDRTGIDLPAESTGMLHPPERWDKLTITRMPMGHGVAVTPVQMLAAMGAIANGGRLMPPRIVRSITRPDGVEVYRLDARGGRQILHPKVASQMRHALEMTVAEGGTATRAAIPGHRVAGKTGTAQKPDPVNGGYMHGKYMVSFAGFFPADNPQVVGFVMVDEAKVADDNYGGTIAAPIFARVGAQVARHLDLRPSGDVAEAIGAGPRSASASVEGR